MNQECPFEVGKEYKTRDGRTAKVVAIVPEANEDSRLVVLLDGQIIGYSYDGRITHYNNDVDLIPPEKPRRVVYQVLCKSDGGYYILDHLFGTKAEAKYNWGAKVIRLLTENPIYVDGPEG